jgi:hypothetical protein
MDRDLSDDLTARMPIVPPGTVTGVDCCGCIVAVVDRSNVELRCNECGAVVGVVQSRIMEGLLGLDCPEAVCPHCGRVNTFSSIERMLTWRAPHLPQPLWYLSFMDRERSAELTGRMPIVAHLYAGA